VAKAENTQASGAQFLSDRQRRHWLRLIRTERVGPVTFKSLVNRFGSAEAALLALPRLAAEGGQLSGMRIPDEAEIDAELERAAAAGARFLALGEPGYPPVLARSDGAPPLLAVSGDVAALNRPAVGIVGSRNASANGMAFARRLAGELGEAGLVVVSGLARGIDRAAHEGGAATGGTVAVLAGGIDRPYPPQNLDLWSKLAHTPGNCLVSTMPFGHEPQARDFPRRNGLIAALSIAVIIVEAAEKSGSLGTARMAADIGRLVFAVPGHPNDPRSAGTNGLIREGADLVRSAEDVLEALRPMMVAGPAALARNDGVALRLETESAADDTSKTEQFPHGASALQTSRGVQGSNARVAKPSATDAPARTESAAAAEAGDPAKSIVAMLGPAPTAIDDIVRETGLAASTVMAALLEMELNGTVTRASGGMVALTA
jgi:DNA processing protein